MKTYKVEFTKKEVDLILSMTDALMAIPLKESAQKIADGIDDKLVKARFGEDTLNIRRG